MISCKKHRQSMPIEECPLCVKKERDCLFHAVTDLTCKLDEAWNETKRMEQERDRLREENEQRFRLIGHLCGREEETKRITQELFPDADLDGDSYFVPSLLDYVEMMKTEIIEGRKERDRLRELIPQAWEAGQARMVGSHECFKQTHPTLREWMEQKGLA